MCVLGQGRRLLAAAMGGENPVRVLLQDGVGCTAEVVLREGGIIPPLAGDKALDLALVLLEQGDGVVLRMPLKEDQAEAVLADRQMHPGLVALRQDPQPGRVELLAADLIEAGMRHVEEGIDVAHQGVGAVHDPMRIDPPPLRAQAVRRWP